MILVLVSLHFNREFQEVSLGREYFQRTNWIFVIYIKSHRYKKQQLDGHILVQIDQICQMTDDSKNKDNKYITVNKSCNIYFQY